MDENIQQATITVRIIKSFEYRNYRSLVLHNVDLHKTTLSTLREMVGQEVKSKPNLKQFEKCQWDTFKMYYQPHGAKTNNPMINTGGDECLILSDYEATLDGLGLGHETEVSYFNREDYERYKNDSSLKW